MKKQVRAYYDTELDPPSIVFKVVDGPGSPEESDIAVTGDPVLAALMAHAEEVFVAIAALGNASKGAQELLGDLKGDDPMAILASLGDKGPENVKAIIQQLVVCIDGVLQAGETVGKLAIALNEHAGAALEARERKEEEEKTNLVTPKQGLSVVKGGKIQ